MKNRWLLVPFLLLVSASALAGTFQEGVNYEAVTPAQPTGVKPGQVEVVEFFWYGCPVCFGLEPYLEAWVKTKPKNVKFRFVHAAMFGSEFYTDARAFYTAQVLGIDDKIREPFFNAIHLDGKGELRDDVDALRTFFGTFGVSAKDFDATWSSFAVQTRMAQSVQDSDRYQVNSVPTIIVNGKWKTGAGYQMAYPDVIKCVKFLVDKERAAMPPGVK